MGRRRKKTRSKNERAKATSKKLGYHIKQIKKGVLGQSTKIAEELDELIDAEEQGSRLLVLCELADIIGAVEAYLIKQFPDIKLADLVSMAMLTKRAFQSGERT